MIKLIKNVLIVITIAVLNLAMLANSVKATEVGLYAKESFNRILKYNGVLVKTTYVVYQKDGIEFPAYCLNVELPGAENGSYNATNQGKITDIGLWRVIINGYPYKKLEELGVNSIEEAYIATKQSIYCYLYNRGTENYVPVNEAGQRALNAMNQILDNAKNSKEEIGELKIEINEDSEWKEDELNEKYISKTYSVSSEININKFKVDIENMSEKVLVTDINNNPKTDFLENDKFKILIPSTKKTNVEFKINITAQLESKPVFYGKAPSENLQDYALTTFSYENVETELSQKYIPPEEPPEEPPREPELPVEEPENIPEEPIKRLPVTGM